MIEEHDSPAVASGYQSRDRGKLAQVGCMKNGPKIPINTGTTRYRYYLVWITRLPPGTTAWG